MVVNNLIVGEANLDDDPIAHVFCRDRRGYVRCMGRGILKTSFFSSAPSREIASREKRAHESVESKYDTIMQRLDEESRARKDLEKKINALSSHGSSHGTHMFDSGDQLGQEMRQSSVHLESPVDQLPSHCILKNFKNKNVAIRRVDRNASQSDLLCTIIVDGIYDISAELYACDGTLRDITPGDIITWPKGLVHFI